MANKQIHQLTEEVALDSTFVIPVQKADGSVEAKKTTIESLKEPLGIEVRVVKNIKTTLSSSEILNLFTTPKEILPAVAGKLYIAKSMFQIYTHATTAYTSIGGGNWRLSYGTTSLFTTSFNPHIQSADNGQAINALNTSSSSVSGVEFSGKSLILSPPSSNPTDGDGSLELYLTYYEITL